MRLKNYQNIYANGTHKAVVSHRGFLSTSSLLARKVATQMSLTLMSDSSLLSDSSPLRTKHHIQQEIRLT